MSFKRNSIPEPMQVVQFKCVQCGRKVSATVNGKCTICGSQRVTPVLDKDPEEKKDVHKTS